MSSHAQDLMRRFRTCDALRSLQRATRISSERNSVASFEFNGASVAPKSQVTSLLLERLHARSMCKPLDKSFQMPRHFIEARSSLLRWKHPRFAHSVHMAKNIPCRPVMLHVLRSADYAGRVSSTSAPLAQSRRSSATMRETKLQNRLLCPFKCHSLQTDACRPYALANIVPCRGTGPFGLQVAVAAFALDATDKRVALW